jgi:hypothetical protein
MKKKIDGVPLDIASMAVAGKPGGAVAEGTPGVAVAVDIQVVVNILAAVDNPG